MTNISSNLILRLPKTLTSKELLVRRRLENPVELERRRQLTQTKSVVELSTIKSFDEFPLPKRIENILGSIKSKTRR